MSLIPSIKEVVDWMRLTPSILNNSENDNRTVATISARCQEFQVSKDSILKVVESGKTRQDAVDQARQEFESQVGYEDQIITTYQNTLPSLSKLRAKVEQTQEKIDGLPTHEMYTSGKAVTSVPDEKKIWQKIFLFVAALFIVVDAVNDSIFLHDTAGYEWLRAILFPIGGVLALSFVLKVFLDVHKKHQQPWFPYLKNFLLLIGLILVIAWAYLQAQTAVNLSQGPKIGGLDETPSTSYAATMDPILQIVFLTVGLAIIGAGLIAHRQKISDDYTEYDGVEESQLYLRLKKDHDNAAAELNRIIDRRTFSDSLIAIISDKRKSVESEAEALYNELRGSGA
jgi:hypothetical protein